MVLGGFLHTVLIVVIHPLAVVMLAARKEVAYIPGFDRRVFVLVHELVRRVEPTLIVTDGTGCLMVHNHLHSFGLGVVMNALDIKIGVRSDEVIDEVFLVSEPVFPTDVPTFDEDTVKTILGSEVDITFHVSGVGAMTAVRFGLRIVGDADMDGREIPGIAPIGTTCNHLPPYTDVLHRFDP